MKKLAATLVGIGFMSMVSRALAAPINIDLKAPAQGISPGAGVGTVLSNALTIIFVVAAIAVLFMLIWGGFQWITSGGEKEKVGEARGRIVNALIGFAILALAFLIVTVVGQILNIDVLKLDSIPTLEEECKAGEVFDPAAPGDQKCVPERKRI